MDQSQSVINQTAITLARRRPLAAPLLALAALVAGLWNLSGPALWWDEGWTLSVARNWVERGHYGRLLDGQLAPPGMEAAFPTTAPIALVFRLFGIGVWQGRLFGVICTVAALGLIYYLALRLYSRPVAIGSLFVLLLMPMHPQLHPLIMGRQVLAEMPMLCYLLMGYAAFLTALRRPLWLPAVMLLWGVALISKAQALPFWACSLLAPLALVVLGRQWRAAALLGASGLGALVVYKLLPGLFSLLLGRHTLPSATVEGLYQVMAIVPNWFNRRYALINILIFGLPTIMGLCYAAWVAFKQRDQALAGDHHAIVRLALLALSGSWLAWYLLLSVGVPRYLFPATFLGSIFVAAWLSDLTSGFDVVATLNSATGLLRKRTGRRQAAGALLAICLVAATLPLTLQTLYREYIHATDTSAERVAAFLNTQTTPDALIETYASELHFLLNRRYHYPPDQLHVELNRRSLLHEQAEIRYDPLAADPDYLVIDRFARENNLYEPVLASGAFRLLRHDGLYDVYERVR